MTPDAFTPANCDLRDFPSMMLEVVRLRNSDLTLCSTGDEFKAAVLLWAAAWHQVPAGSLPDNERKLAGLAKVDAKRWAKLRAEAMRGWSLCSDGRLHHAVIAEKALECWISKLNNAISSGAGNAKRYQYDFDRAPLDADLDEAMRRLLRLNPKSKALHKAKRGMPPGGVQPAPEPAPAGSPTGMPLGSQEKRREGITLPEGAKVAVETPSQEAWRRAKTLLVLSGGVTEAKAGRFFGGLLRDHKLEPSQLLPAIVAAELKGTPEPEAYLVSAARGVARRAKGEAAAPAVVDVSTWGEDVWTIAVARYRADGSWSGTMGPEPGSPGCIIPAHLLLKSVEGGAA